MSLIERWTIYVSREDGLPVCQPGPLEAERHRFAAVEVVPAEQLAEVVSREHAVQAIGWLSAEVAVHGAPSLGPEWLELWDRALTATGGSNQAILIVHLQPGAVPGANPAGHGSPNATV
jgi:hypothetical protein